MKTLAWKKEWSALAKKERSYINKAQKKKQSFITKTLEDKVPEKLQEQLDKAFSKAFQLTFEKGTGLIEKGYKKEDLEFQYKMNEYGLSLQGEKKGLKVFAKQANKSANQNVMLSGAKGMGLGLFGIGLPDIPIFIGIMLKSIYEIALQYGYTYDSEKERYFILCIVKSALDNDNIKADDEEINSFIINQKLPPEYLQSDKIKQTASQLSTELLYVKFLQGLPIVGVVGGVFDAVFTNQILNYAKMKYHRRFLFDKYMRAEIKKL